MTTRSQIRRMYAWFGAVAAVALLVLGAWHSGLAVPRLTLDTDDPHIFTSNDDAGRTRRMILQLGHTLVNDGWFPVTVSGAALRSDGLRLTNVRESGGRAFPLTVRPGERIQLILLVTVTDCEQAAATDPEPLIRADRWWGSQTTSPDRQPESDWDFYLRTACDR